MSLELTRTPSGFESSKATAIEAAQEPAAVPLYDPDETVYNHSDIRMFLTVHTAKETPDDKTHEVSVGVLTSSRPLETGEKLTEVAWETKMAKKWQNELYSNIEDWVIATDAKIWENKDSPGVWCEAITKLAEDSKPKTDCSFATKVMWGEGSLIEEEYNTLGKLLKESIPMPRLGTFYFRADPFVDAAYESSQSSSEIGEEESRPESAHVPAGGSKTTQEEESTDLGSQSQLEVVQMTPVADTGDSSTEEIRSDGEEGANPFASNEDPDEA